jgi:hypothetical protein
VLNRSRRLVLVSRVGLAGAIMFSTLVLTLGSDVPSSSAGNTAFCKTIESFITTFETNLTPKAFTTKGYQAWGRLLYPYFEKLSTESTGKTKATVTVLEGMFNYYSHAASIKALNAYEKANQAKFDAGTKALGQDVASCA